MRNLYFYSDGYFSRKEKKNYRHGILEFVAIDISTNRKGPVYTLVKSPLTDFKDSKIEIKFEVVYSDNDDCPFDMQKSMQSVFEVNSASRFYSIYPLLRQMFAFNIFSESGIFHNHLFIQSIDIRYNSTHIYVDETMSDKKLRKSFEYVNMTTDVRKILHYEKMYIGLNTSTKKWDFIDESYDIYRNKEEFDAVVIPLDNGISMETCYIMSFEYFQNLHVINNSMIVIRHFPRDSGSYFENGPADQYESEFFFNDVFSLLEASIFIPQIILMESEIYDMETLLDVVLTIEDNNYYLTVDDRQMRNPKNSCIFHLIEKLLDIALTIRE